MEVTPENEGSYHPPFDLGVGRRCRKPRTLVPPSQRPLCIACRPGVQGYSREPTVRPPCLWMLRILLILLSECFSPFDRSTCRLSVSRQYPSLRGVYLAFGLQSQETLLLGVPTTRQRATNDDERTIHGPSLGSTHDRSSTGLSPSIAHRSR